MRRRRRLQRQYSAKVLILNEAKPGLVPGSHDTLNTNRSDPNPLKEKYYGTKNLVCLPWIANTLLVPSITSGSLNTVRSDF